MSGRRGSSVVHDTTYDPLVEEPLSGGAHDSLRVLRPDPPLLPSIIFPLGPPSAETSAERNVRLGAAEFFPGASRQVRRVRKRRREGNEWTARVERRTWFHAHISIAAHKGVKMTHKGVKMTHKGG